MARVKVDHSVAKGFLVTGTPPAQVNAPVPPAAPGTTQSSAAAVTTQPKPYDGPRAPSAGGSAQSYRLTAADIGSATFTFGNRGYNVIDSLGRPFAPSDVGHVVTEVYGPDGWMLTFA